MRIGELDLAELKARLTGPGLRFATGPFVFSVRSRVPRIARGLAQLYGDFPLADPAGFADFHVRVQLARGVRRWIRPQALFDLDGYRPFAPLPGSQAFALLEWGMNWCIYTHAHDFLVIHGAAMERGGSALLLPAPAGAGKSTLCAAMMQRGWRLLSDELILFDAAQGTVHGLGRPVSLKNVSIDIMRDYAPEAFVTEPMHDTAKGSVAHMRPDRHSVQAVDRPAAPCHVVFPRFRAGANTRVETLSRADVFVGLVENEFNYSLLRREGFRAMAALVDAVDGHRLEHGDLDAAIGALERISDGVSG